MTALFWDSPYRLGAEEVAIFPTWRKGWSAFRKMMAQEIADALGIHPRYALRYVPRTWEW